MSNLPRYKCHKEVGALKIKALQHNPDGSLTITPAELGFAPFNVEASSVPLHSAARPEPGWYYVEYENGYVSFSPAKAFEEGYKLIVDPTFTAVDVTAENQAHTDIPIDVTAKQAGVEKAPKKKAE